MYQLIECKALIKDKNKESHKFPHIKADQERCWVCKLKYIVTFQMALPEISQRLKTDLNSDVKNLPFAGSTILKCSYDAHFTNNKILLTMIHTQFIIRYFW